MRFLLFLVLSAVPLLAADRPNAIFFIADDVSWDDLGCYGNTAARTPNIDRLAANGRRFDEAYLTASSCSPSRSSIITGRYPHNNGRASELHQPISAHLPWFPRLMKDAGYYTALVGKNHMSSDEPAAGEAPQPPAFDLIAAGNEPGNKGGHATWVKTLQERPKDKPFFFWFASLDAHRDWDADKDWKEELYGQKHQPQNVRVPPALRDDEATRKDLASYYNEITRFDYFVGQVLKELESQGQLDNTLIFVSADNGRAFPRAKTRLHDSGMKAMLVAHWPARLQKAGVPTASLASSIDLAPTYLAAAGITPPPSMQGVSLLPLLENPEAAVRNSAFSEHNWHDYEAHGRAVRSEGFLYIRNNRPQQPWQGPADSVRSPSHQALVAAQTAGMLTEAQKEVLLAPRPTEELYRTAADADQLNNLAISPDYASVKERLSKLLDQWVDETGDDVPADLSPDGFDRVTGKPVAKQKKGRPVRGTPAGWNRGASKINAPGPR